MLQTENFRLRQSLRSAVDGALNTFIEIFEEKSFCNSDNLVAGRTDDRGESSASSHVHNLCETETSNGCSAISQVPDPKISPDLLTRSQFQKVQHIFSYLATIKSTSEKLHLLFHNKYAIDELGDDADAEAKLEIERLQNEATQNKKREGKQLKIICALRDYLMIEINRSEDADTQLKLAEDKLVKMTVERNKYMKVALQLQLNNMKGETLTADGNGLVFRKTAAAPVVFNTEMPELYCGSFVRKKFGNNYFFGLIVYFRQPFFKIIYEDCDIEEMTFKDLSTCFWPTSVPSTKAAQCKRHAISAGLYNEVEAFADTEDIDVQSEVRHFVLHGTASNSDDSSSSNSSSSNMKNSSIEDGDKDNATDNSSISSVINTDSISSGLKRFRSPEKENIDKRSCSISTRYNGKRVEDSYGYKKESRVIYDWDKDGNNLKNTLRNGEKRVKKVDSRDARTGSGTGGKDLIDLSTEDSDSTNAEVSDSDPSPSIRHTDTVILRTEISVP